MRHQFGWDLPPGVTSAMIDAQCGDDHDPKCPAHEDAVELCACGCDAEGHPKDHCDSLLSSECGCEGLKIAEPECICADLDADRAEAKADAMRDQRDC